MNAAWLRFVKSAYRSEPITSFVVTVGAVDAAIGGIGNSGSLFSFGLLLVGIAAMMRWWQIHRSSDATETETVVQHYLPPSSSRPQLPLLTSAKKRPPM